jgi:diacylglycerol kinase family enzyme
MRKLAVIYNPRSGRHRVEKTLHQLIALLPHEDAIVDAWNIQECTITAAELAGRDCVVVIGGDGTLRTILQVLLDANLDIPIALVPRGSANLLAKSLGIPFTTAGAARSILGGTTVAVDVGRLSTGEYFVGAFALGYFSHRVTATDRQLKKVAGFAGYLWSFIRETKLPEHNFSFMVDDRTYTIQGHSLFIVNTSNLFGIHSSRVADFRDGIFELTVTTNKTFLSLINLLIDFYLRRGKSSHFILIPGSRFSLRNMNGSRPQIDGEALTERDSLDITVIPRKQRFIIP